MVKSGTAEHAFWQQLYLLYSHHSEPNDTDEYWKGLFEEAAELEKKYRNTECSGISKILIFAVMNALEQKEKLRK